MLNAIPSRGALEAVELNQLANSNPSKIGLKDSLTLSFRNRLSPTKLFCIDSSAIPTPYTSILKMLLRPASLVLLSTVMLGSSRIGDIRNHREGHRSKISQQRCRKSEISVDQVYRPCVSRGGPQHQDLEVSWQDFLLSLNSRTKV